MKKSRIAALLALLTLASGGFSLAETRSGGDVDVTVTHAMEFTSTKLLSKVRNMGVTFHWLGQGDRFWYRKSVSGYAVEFVVVDASTGKESLLFVPTAMKNALAKAGSQESDVASIRALDVSDDGHSLVVSVRKNGAQCRWPQGAGCDVAETRYRCDLPVSACESVPESSEAEILSPDRRLAAFVRDHNLWIRNAGGGNERQLTHEGVEGFSYGVLLEQFGTNEVYRRRAGLAKPLAGVAWSPDGRFILALRHDLRILPPRLAVTEYLPPEGGMPIVHMVRQAITTDTKYPDAALDVVDVTSGTVHRSDVDPQMLTYQTLGYVWWTNRNTKVWLVEVDRANREERLVCVDMPDGRSHVSIVETAQHPLKRGGAAIGSEIGRAHV